MTTPIRTHRCTKIVATLGPKTNCEGVLEAIIRAGVNVCRVNCSHASHDGIRAQIAHVRRTAAAIDKPVAILLDLQGPKIRVGKVDQPLELECGDLLEVVMDERVGSGKRCGTTYSEMADDVVAGDRVLFDDGKLSGAVEAVLLNTSPKEVHIRIDVGGLLGSNKGINLPDAKISAASVTEKDRADLIVGVNAGVDYVALSFVRSPEDVLELKRLLKEAGATDIPIISKIERRESVENIDAILKVSDGIMVARGDLGVEMPLEKLPIYQKQLIRAANRHGALVITATQMLDSMERNPRPTRAETTDVANAILDGTDAVMLSGETAVGLYPVEAVTVMDSIARNVECSEFFRAPTDDERPTGTGSTYTVAAAATQATQGRRALVLFTWSGLSARVASKFRPITPFFALAPTQAVCDRLAMVWGAQPIRVPTSQNTDELISIGERELLKRKLIAPGDEVVVVAGTSTMKGANNLMKLLVVGE
jgi:pyruvate kinase